MKKIYKKYVIIILIILTLTFSVYLYNINNNIVVPTISNNITFPTYIQNELDEKLKKSNYKYDNSIFSFSLITDTHINNSSNTENNIDAFINISNQNNILFSVCDGDIYSAYSTKKDEGLHYLTEFKHKISDIKNKDVFIAKGNHDCNAKLEESEFISNIDFYNIFFSDSSYKFQNKSSYYYKDYEKYKVRVCVLNSFNGVGQEFIFGKDQLLFLSKDMLNFESKKDKEKWSIIIFAHTLDTEDFDDFNNIITAFSKGDEIVIDGQVIEFNGNGNVIGAFTGHKHEDVYYNNEIYNNITFQRGFNYENEIGSKNEIGFDVVTVDLDKRVIYDTRFGRGQDRKFDF